MSTLFNKQIRCPFCELKFPSRTNYVNKVFEEVSSHQFAVEKFMTLGGQEIPAKPTIPSLQVRKLRAKLILEEALETIKALGLYVTFDSDAVEPCTPGPATEDQGFQTNFFELKSGPNLVEIIDGCCDLRVVTTGTLSACGIKDIRPQELVDQNNLEKFRWTEDQIQWATAKDRAYSVTIYPESNFASVRNSFGKVMKPPTFQKVDLETELKRQENL